MTSFIFTRYMTRLFLTRFFFIGTGFTAILLIFDVLANADTVTEHHSDILTPLIMYSVLRLPDILSLVLPLTALFSTILTIYQSVMSQEMVAMRASGMPAYHMIGMFILPAIIICCAHGIIVNSIQPETSTRLSEWEKFDYRDMPPEQRMENTAGWISIGNTLLQVEKSSPNGKVLQNIDVVARDNNGLMVDYFTAEQAIYHDKGWTFQNIERADFGRNVVTKVPALRVALPIKPKLFSSLASKPEQLSLIELKNLAGQNVMQKKPSYIYELWFHRKIAYALSSAVMILLAMPLLFRLSRSGSPVKTVSVICLMGFGFVVIERLFQTFGADATLSPLLAAWSPLILFAVLGSWTISLQR